MKDISALNFATMLNALAHASAFPTALSDKEPISVLQTHASAVLLTTRRAYKVKKTSNTCLKHFTYHILPARSER